MLSLSENAQQEAGLSGLRTCNPRQTSSLRSGKGNGRLETHGFLRREDTSVASNRKGVSILHLCLCLGSMPVRRKCNTVMPLTHNTKIMALNGVLFRRKWEMKVSWWPYGISLTAHWTTENINKCFFTGVSASCSQRRRSVSAPRGELSTHISQVVNVAWNWRRPWVLCGQVAHPVWSGFFCVCCLAIRPTRSLTGMCNNCFYRVFVMERNIYLELKVIS